MNNGHHINPESMPLNENGRRVHRQVKNPFQRGETVEIPRGTPYTITAPEAGEQETKRKSTACVSHRQDGFRGEMLRNEKGLFYQAYLPSITVPGTGGYWKRIIVTEEMLRANGKPVEYNEFEVF